MNTWSQVFPTREKAVIMGKKQINVFVLNLLFMLLKIL